MDLQIEHVEDARLKLRGEIDAANAYRLEEALQAAIGSGSRLVLDMSEVTFMDSTPLHVLVRAASSLQGRGTLVVQDPSAFVRRILEITGLDQPRDHLPLEIS